MINPTEADIGRGVIYCKDSKLAGGNEHGKITSFNDHCVFVNFNRGGTSAGCAREDLDWEFPSCTPASSTSLRTPLPSSSSMEDTIKHSSTNERICSMPNTEPGSSPSTGTEEPLSQQVASSKSSMTEHSLWDATVWGELLRAPALTPEDLPSNALHYLRNLEEAVQTLRRYLQWQTKQTPTAAKPQNTRLGTPYGLPLNTEIMIQTEGIMPDGNPEEKTTRTYLRIIALPRTQKELRAVIDTLLLQLPMLPVEID